MMKALFQNLNNIHIIKSEEILTPEELKKLVPISNAAAQVVWNGRCNLGNIINGLDNRKIIIVGPCSIHDINAARDYANKLCQLAKEVEDKFLVVMRVYFEKPRTTIGWKGFINDPDLDDSFNVEKGLTLARTLLLEISELGLPIATEALDPLIPQYLSQFISWSAVGARTTESQTHREMASGLSMPVGFKNSTNGRIDIAVNAMQSAKTSHRFLGINKFGKPSVFTTTGNSYVHLILRGGDQTNYDRESIKESIRVLEQNKLPSKIIVDCSHGNSNKDYRNQTKVFNNLIEQINEGNSHIIGMMLESNLREGKQSITQYLKQGVSITDGCISWEETEKLIKEAYDNVII